MPDKIEVSILSRCGMNCMVCYKHCNSKKACNGCFSDDSTNPKHCKQCKIKQCVIEKGITYCFECSDFPCKRSKQLDRSYEKYHGSLIVNSEDAREMGVSAFLKEERQYWRCDRCGGVISLHDGECTECHAKLEDMRLGPYAYFGMIDCFEEIKNYEAFREGMSFKECLKKYHCVAIPDEMINDWWDGIVTMKSYHHEYDRPETALARWGVTLIPPESLLLFSDVIKTHTSERFATLCKEEMANLLVLLEKARAENKFIIHYGI